MKFSPLVDEAMRSALPVRARCTGQIQRPTECASLRRGDPAAADAAVMLATQNLLASQSTSLWMGKGTAVDQGAMGIADRPLAGEPT